MTSVGQGDGSILAPNGDALADGVSSLDIGALSLSPNVAQEDIQETQQLLAALHRLSDTTNRKSNIRSTRHSVRLAGEAANTCDAQDSRAATIEEEGDNEASSRQHAGSAHLSAALPGHVTLTSWKTNEFAYRKTTKIGYSEQDELPTLARGLFTCRSAQGTERIVVRGYDKFFNEGELPWTKPRAIEHYSTAPYELSFKENGCIIFIAALTPTQLLVTSKHSLGSGEAGRPTHAQMGEVWLDKHLSSAGRSKSDLARALWARNETAVAELCDDSFEEHVLAYPAERTGLHLHGLNKNVPQFQTRSMREVEAFAKEWGFLPTRFIEMGSLDDVDRFCQRVAETGSWQGVPIEGFVVRTRMPQQVAMTEKSIIAPPYRPRQVWFYKVKFDEPYLMYRDWRELTRKMLSEKEKWDKARADAPSPSIDNAPVVSATASAPSSAETDKSKSQAKKDAKKVKAARAKEEAAKRAAEAAAGVAPPDPPQTRSKRLETKLFVEWCYEQLYGKQGAKMPLPDLFAGFSHNQGIIRVRETFLSHLHSDEGQLRLREMEKGSKATSTSDGGDVASPSEPFTKTLIVPVAVPGCGKTIVAVALQRLLDGMSHTQSDDVTTKKTGPTFLKNVQAELDAHDIVFADRNNHLFKHRNEIVNAAREWATRGTRAAGGKKSKHNDRKADATKTPQRVRLIALAWSLDALPLNAIHHICSDRIVGRGDNHQSLRLTEEREHEQILWQFLRDLEPFGSAEQGGGDKGYGDEAFHEIIRMELNASLEQNVNEAVCSLARVLHTGIPSKEEIRAAVEFAKQYKVRVKKEVKGVPLRPPRYYALALELNVQRVLDDLLQDNPEAHEAFQRLLRDKRLNEAPHVTLVHSTEVKAEHDETGQRAAAQKRWDLYSAQSKLSQPIVFHVTIDLIAWDDRAMALGVCGVESPDFVSLAELQGAHWRPHVTLGTFAEDIRPYEGNRVVQDADMGRPEVHCHRFNQALSVTGRIKGLS